MAFVFVSKALNVLAGHDAQDEDCELILAIDYHPRTFYRNSNPMHKTR